MAICFDYFQVSAVYMKSQAILSMYSYSSTFGIVGKLRAAVCHSVV